MISPYKLSATITLAISNCQVPIEMSARLSGSNRQLEIAIGNVPVADGLL